MPTALDVAQYLIHLAVTGDEPDALSHLRLQKLLYYVQSWHLAAFGKPMFEDRVEAWRDGPVVTSVWPHFKQFGYAAIIPTEKHAAAGLSRYEQMFVDAIWDKYKVFSATQLSKMTHRETPWQIARGDLPANESSSAEITQESMRRYFASGLAAKMPRFISLPQLIQADEEIDRGNFKRHDELRARLNERRNAL